MTTYYLLEGRLTKPTGVTWWSEAFPDQARERVATLKALNLANPWIYTKMDGDNEMYQMYFATYEDFTTFTETSKALPSTPIWHAYNDEHGIIETITTGFVEADPGDLAAATNG